MNLQETAIKITSILHEDNIPLKDIEGVFTIVERDIKDNTIPYNPKVLKNSDGVCLNSLYINDDECLAQDRNAGSKGVPINPNFDYSCLKG